METICGTADFVGEIWEEPWHSDDEGARELTDIVGCPTSVADIWLGITSFETDCGARAESCSGGKILFYRYRRLLKIFSQGLCWIGIFGSGSTSVQDVDAIDWSLGTTYLVAT